MTYKKPEINPLGDAAQLIQLIGKGIVGEIEFSTPDWTYNPAYDLDE